MSPAVPLCKIRKQQHLTSFTCSISRRCVWRHFVTLRSPLPWKRREKGSLEKMEQALLPSNKKSPCSMCMWKFSNWMALNWRQAAGRFRMTLWTVLFQNLSKILHAHFRLKNTGRDGGGRLLLLITGHVIPATRFTCTTHLWCSDYE